MMPARFEELKRSAARAGALTALTRAKAWIPDLDPADVGNGYPSIKEDGSDFDNEDLRALTKEMHPLASKLAEALSCAWSPRAGSYAWSPYPGGLRESWTKGSSGVRPVIHGPD